MYVRGPIRLLQPCVTPRQCVGHPFCASSVEVSSVATGLCDADGDWTAGAVWRGGEQLADWLMERIDLVNGRSILELGAGTGIAGIAAAYAGAASVVLSDQQTEQAAANVLLNPAVASRLHVRRLHWGAEEARGIAADVVIGADLVYPAAEASLQLLIESLGTIRRPALLSYIERSATTSAKLQDALRQLGARCRWMPWHARAHSKGSFIILDAWNSTIAHNGTSCFQVHNITTLREQDQEL